MNSKQKHNLNRLFNPRHIAFIGGADAAFSARQCALTFDGEVWGVNPNRETLGGVPCYPSVKDLPAPPDAVFIATPRAATTSIVAELQSLGAGGVVCFTAGYGELGESGKTAENQLIRAAGDMALVGPNCYGVVNYTNGAMLWPFGAGTHTCKNGIALIMQSGMLPANMTMNDRSVPITHIVSAGNQSVLAIEDYIDFLLDDNGVRAIGIYAEGIRDVGKFATAAHKALKLAKPIAIIKAGKSDIATSLSITHTGSLSGSDDAFQALFDRLGIIRVHSPAEMLETLKFVSVSGAPSGYRVAGFTCSGGDAAMLADACDQAGLQLPAPDVETRNKLEKLLPDIATVTNPLDYTTPLWGNTEVMPDVFATLIAGGYDAAVVIQDFPPAHIHDDPTLYLNDAASFSRACQERGIPAAVCSDLPENIDSKTRSMLIQKGVTPLQGLDTGVIAIANACRYGARRPELLKEHRLSSLVRIAEQTTQCDTVILDEWQGKLALQAAGLTIPDGKCVALAEVGNAADTLGYPVVLKAVSASLPHKSEAGAVKVGLHNRHAVIESGNEMAASILRYQPDLDVQHYLVEVMEQNVVAELLVGVSCDAQFGLVMVIACGGELVELIKDKATLLLPASERQITEALYGLQSFPLLDGFRNRPKADIAKLVQAIQAIAQFAIDRANILVEMDVNPLLVTTTDTVVVDVMIRQKNI